MTKRAVAFLATALLLYFFANQTQVGWLYAMAALLAGTVPAAWWLGRGQLRGLRAERLVAQERESVFEGDAVTVQLCLENRGRLPAAQLQIAERCPLAAPDDPLAAQSLFLPLISPGSRAVHSYEVIADRRGLHHWSELVAESGAPFGLFRRRSLLPAPAALLVYPEVRPLRRFRLLDRQPAPQLAERRAGVGSEVIGLRPYRVGDSPRHIHWRSVARTGQLISKEFAAEQEPGVTLLLDLQRHPYPDLCCKANPFEWGVKVSASIGDYAKRKGYPLSLATDQAAWPAPSGPIGWEALLHFLARVEPTGSAPLSEVLASHRAQPRLVVVLPWPDSASLPPLLAAHQRGQPLAVVLIDPASFPDGGQEAVGLAAALAGAGIEHQLVRYGEPWELTLGMEPDR